MVDKIHKFVLDLPIGSCPILQPFRRTIQTLWPANQSVGIHGMHLQPGYLRERSCQERPGPDDHFFYPEDGLRFAFAFAFWMGNDQAPYCQHGKCNV